MSNYDGCQLPSVPKFAVGNSKPKDDSLTKRFKRLLAVPWNRYVKKWIKRAYYATEDWRAGESPKEIARKFAPTVPFTDGELVKVRSHEEILSTLGPFKELKGCAFLPSMAKYCGTQQRVLRSMRNFMDERDYKLKKVRGVILLENVICNGNATFGECDRCCFLFWREEWLEKIAS